MKNGIVILVFLCFSCLSAQKNIVQSVYFEFDKFVLEKSEMAAISAIIESPDFSKFEAIQLYGYCDDRGTSDYNQNLSKKRVEVVQQVLISNGISADKIFICEGRGRIMVDRDTVQNLKEIRNRNRRVDLFFVTKTTYYYFPETPKVGDNIILERVKFNMGSSELSTPAKMELDRTVVLLKKHKSVRFQIKGHVCCTSSKYFDAIDNETQNRDLSENRAKNVFMYLRSKGISPYRMSYKGYGNRLPLGKEENQDRRVELYITQM